MAKYEYNKDNELRKTLIDFISAAKGTSSEDRENYTRNLNYKAVANDVTGSLGVWGIKQK